MPQSSAVLRKRVAGALLMALGAFALAAPVAAGRWSLAILGIPLIALSVTEAYATFTSPRRADASAYLPSLLALFAGILLLLSSALVLSGLLILLLAILLIDGSGKLLTVWRMPRSLRVATIANGFVDLGCAALLWYLNHIIGTERAIGIVVGAYIAAAGWRILMAPVEAVTPDAAAAALGTHPDPGLRLPPNDTFARLRAKADTASQTVRAADLMWMLTLAAGPADPRAATGPTGDRLFRRLQPDLGIQLVFQHGKLGDRRLSENDGIAGRPLASRHDRRNHAPLRRGRRRPLSNQSQRSGR